MSMPFRPTRSGLCLVAFSEAPSDPTSLENAQRRVGNLVLPVIWKQPMAELIPMPARRAQ
jgi:hypothetical protein